jgi:NADH:ubiquinone oxidoreductase subunit
MKNFLKQIFTWWHKHTIGTFIYTLFFGKFVSKDKFGNKYYSNSYGKRWVVYKGEIESTKIPPEWHAWIHFTNLKIPVESVKKFSWQKEHEENNTGSEDAYKPEGSLSFENKKVIKKYDTWKS